MVFSISVCTGLSLRAQQGNLRCLTLVDGSKKLVLTDSLIIDPQSIAFSDGREFQYESESSTIKWSQPSDEMSELCYRVISINVNKTYFHKSSALYDSSASFRPLFMQKNTIGKKDELFTTPNIYKAGSLTRGISFGNTQSVNVISAFNFQMDGKLTDNLNIRADITDQNVPFQPEGNTLQLREFDNVTFEIYNDDLSLKAGDVLLRNYSTYFLKYYKNALGGQLDVKYDLPDGKGKGRSSLAVSAAKGQFADITLVAEEGLQGPYQLNGPEGQNYVIVLANSEKVYLDGRLMKRGYNYDYTIDYNLGEVTFNPNILITQFSRIRVTFEYSDQSYSRSILAAHQEVEIGKLHMNFDYYREKDDLHRPLSFDLSDEDKLKMSLAGDENLPVPIESGQRVAFNPTQALYVKKDTIDVDGNLQTIFQYSNDSTAELYQVSFSRVGFGLGDYNLTDSDINGRVYEWVSPAMGEPMGEYAAVRFVPAPNMKQMAVIGAKIDLTDHLSVQSELAFSNANLNLYSDIDNEDNKDLSNKTGLVLGRMPVNFLEGYHLSGNLDYEFNGKDFKTIDRFRTIEYDRDWSYNPDQDTAQTSNKIFNAAIKIEKNYQNFLSARFSTRNKQSVIDGQQLEFIGKKTLGPLKLSAAYFDMENNSVIESSTWNRWNAEAYFDQFFIVPGYQVSADQNEVRVPNSDSLVRSAMNYNAHKFYLRSRDSSKTTFRLEQILRKDNNILDGRLVPYTLSKTTSANLATPQSGKHYFNLTMTYRELEYQEDYAELENENLILGRVLWRSAYLKNHVRADMNYATSSSREILREYIFVQVPPGEGTHTWRDLNGDGIQDITEFFEAVNFDERNYIKVFVPTSDFVNAFNTIFIFTLNAEMPRTWKNSQGLKGVLGKLSNRTNVNINKKTTDDDFNSRFNPFALTIDDADLIFARDGLRSTFFYNRSGRGFGADATYSINRSKQLISRGIDSKNNEEFIINMRYHLSREISLTWRYVNGQKRNASQFQENRNFNITSREIAPGLTWQPTNNVRMSIQYSLEDQENIESETEESSKINEVRLESRWTSGHTNSLSGGFAFNKIDFIGDLNTASAYELLNALQPGNNTSWQLTYNQKLISGLQMNLGYEGRKSQDQPVIHMGRLQVTALF